MLSTTHTSRAKILQSRAGTSLSPSTSLLRCGLQTRQLCFGAWSLSVGSGSHGRRRHRARYQYMESLNRNLSWDKDAHKTIKKAMAAFARATEPSNKKYVNVDEIKSWSDESSGTRPGKNIEDVERGAIDHLIRGDKPLSYDYDMWSPLHNIRSYLESQRGSRSITPKDLKGDAAETETYIDPITNRRVSKSTPMYNDLDGYRPTEFSSSEPVSSPPKYDDLDKYVPVKDTSAPQPTKARYEDQDEYEAVRWNEPDGLRKITPEEASKQYNDLDKYSTKIGSSDTQRKLTPEEQSKSYGDLDKYKPVEWNEPDGLQKPTEEELSKNYGDLGKYGAVRWNEPDGLQKKSGEELSKNYDDLHKYDAVRWNEPDGLRMQTQEELSKNYDDLNQYGAVHWNEPDGLRKPTPEELSKDYKDLNKYDAVRWSEPDGLRRLTPEELSKNYEDLDAYNTPFVAKKSTLQAHEDAQMDTTVKGEVLPNKVDAPVHDPASEYKDLDEYGPVRWNEPDGLRKLTPEEASKNYNDLHLYGQVKWNEPDGLRRLTPEEKSKEYHDVPLYAARDLEPEVSRIHPEDASKEYKDLPAYHHFDSAPNTRVHPEEASKNYEDLGKYAAYENNGPDRVHPEQASKDYNDLSKYSASVEAQHPEELTKNYEDLDKYSPSAFDSVDTPYPIHPEEATKAYKDLDRYSAIRHNEPDGKPASVPDAVARGLKYFDSKAGPQDTRIGPSVTYPFHHRTNLDSEVDDLTAQEIRATTMRRVQESQDEPEQGILEPNLTGNYARDFPEEFATSWTKCSSTLVPKDRSQANHDSVEVSSMDESFPIDDHKIQPAIDRYWAKIDKEIKDPYSQEPQGLQTSFAEECGQETLPTVEKHYAKAAADLAASYKILAYDASSHTMSIADATTTMNDDSTSTLSDVLLRLSNPSKFLPYFESLQSQGYDIVSGSGDVLIFRKVRQGDDKPIFSPRINPIDMMGKSAIGTFTSPTGFVNYDATESAAKPAPPNPVVNETIPEQGPARGRTRRRLGRKVILGTAGLAGSAYAVAVFGEYFSTRANRANRDEPKPKGL
ncbi:hypothetical protein BGZ61DRAFT_452112 [Ilyonectria robusta]|uniref:uncharacterized protein n=1 Tax=Ilyonectria robusta TaxID=1079257 RepID=UPI001E8E424D|nr:uncharacterized protein BGZ61DRAFT_452112 [Ilyonectria robusta]KAH8694566.1 hypothetical protein BGZ61DRAFT_452112 [Ilyonectria robusta]